MSVSQPARCLFSRSVPKGRSLICSKNFHTSPPQFERRRPRYASVKASDVAAIEESKKRAHELFKSYTSEERAVLLKKYTPEQVKAIEAGEAAIDPQDLDRHGVVRTDIGALPYLDDFSHTRSVIDREQKYEGPVDPHMRPMTENEFWASWKRKEKELAAKAPQLPKPDDPEDPEYLKKVFPTRVDDERIAKEMELFMGKDGPVPRYMTPSYEAPTLPINFLSDGTKKAKITGEDDVDQRNADGIYNRLMKQTGLTLNEIFAFNVKILVKHRVVNQTRLGKIQSLYCLAIAGNGDGRLGIGEAKGQEVEETQVNARIAAIRSMQPIPRYEQRTIYGDVEGKVSAVEVKLMSRPPGEMIAILGVAPANFHLGFGLRCQHNIFEMARAAGIHDLAAKVPRSRNKMNTIKATYQALMKQRIPDEVARGLGKKLVDVRKVYYGGRV